MATKELSEDMQSATPPFPNRSFQVLEVGHPDRRFGAQERLGKDGCGY